MVGLNGDGDWAIFEGFLNSINALGGDALDSGRADVGCVVLHVFASAVLLCFTRDIWVVFFLHLRIAVEVFEGKLEVTTVAAMVLEYTIVTIDKLLFGELEELFALGAPAALHSGLGGESPA